MADFFAAEITLGGNVFRRLVPRLCRLIQSEQLGLDWGGADFAPESAEDLLAARQTIAGEHVLQLHNDRARYGEFAELEGFLVRHRIPYDRRCEGYGEYSPTVECYRPPNGITRWTSGFGGQLLVAAEPLWSLVDRLRLQQTERRKDRRTRLVPIQRVLTELDELLPARPRPLPSFEIGKSQGLRKVA